MIYKLKDISLERFEAALFEHEYGDIENFEDLYDEFIKKAGLGENEQVGLMEMILYYQARVYFITEWLLLHRRCMGVVSQPSLKAIDEETNNLNIITKRYGHRIVWTRDKGKFLKDLDKIELREKINVVELRRLEKEREQVATAEKTHDANESRNQFLLMIAYLQKDNWPIDETTNMEVIALIIREQAKRADQAKIKQV